MTRTNLSVKHTLTLIVLFTITTDHYLLYFLQLVTIPVNLVHLIVLLSFCNSITIVRLVCNVLYF